MPTLNVNQSVVDFLKSRGFVPETGDKFPLFGQRKRLYESLAMPGEYIGSMEQNPALLQELIKAERQSGVSLSPTNVLDVISSYRQPKPTYAPFKHTEYAPIRRSTEYAPIKRPEGVQPNMVPVPEYIPQQGQIGLDLMTIPEGALPKSAQEGQVFSYFTDPSSGKKYFFSANSPAQGQAIADALKSQYGITNIQAQRGISPLEQARASGFWPGGTPDETLKRWAEAGNVQGVVDLTQGYEDITGRLGTRTVGQVPAGPLEQPSALGTIIGGTAPAGAQPQEGDTRINPQTGIQEMYNPEGQWVPLTPGMQPTGQEKVAPWQQVIPPEAITPQGTILTSGGEKTLPEITDQGGNVLPQYLTDIAMQAGAAKGEPGIDVSTLFQEIPENLSQLALEKVMAGATYPLQKEQSEAEKAAERVKQQSEIEKFLQGMATKGLTFSGIKEKGLKSLEADQLATLLNIDRKFALLIAQGMESAAKQIVTEAQRGNTEAHQTLRALGYDIIGGKILPTVEAQRLAVSQAQPETREVQGGLYDVKTGKWLIPPTEAKGPTSYQEWQLAGGVQGTGTTYAQFLEKRGETTTETTRALKVAALAKARPALEASRGKDGFVDPNVYMRLRNDYVNMIGDVSEFDAVFSPMLSLQERQRRGIGKVTL